ncbi:MAG: OmpA family protein [Bacteroidia bacterium]
MKLLKDSLNLFYIILFVSCNSNHGVDNVTTVDPHLNNDSIEIYEVKSNSRSNLERKETNEFKANWRNPYMNPYGASVVNYVRAFFLTGQFEKMRPFLIGGNCFSEEEFAFSMNKSIWGYEIDVTNLKWSKDSVFILTCITMKNNTKGIEEYSGKIINDTAKLFYKPYQKGNPFLYNYKNNCIDYCVLHQLANSITFKIGKDEFTASGLAAMEKIYDVLKNCDEKISIYGHTSKEGDNNFNLKLSQKRADAVKALLTKKGIKSTRIESKGFGHLNPIYFGDDPLGQEKNRRVEIIIN